MTRRDERHPHPPRPEPEAPPAPRVRPPLVIHDVEFMGGLAALGGWRPDNKLPEIAFTGRSNVGKSSLLNHLVRRKSFARVSRTPGRTREINFFRVNQRFVFVDLPGYGYARVAKDRKAEWRPLMETYLKHSRQLRGIVQLLDVRREPTPDDLDMFDFLAELEVPVLVAVTKIDKLSTREGAARVEAIARTLGLDLDQLIPFSAFTGQGRDELAAAIEQLVEQAEATQAAAEAAWAASARERVEPESDAPSGAGADPATESRNEQADARP